MWKKRNHLRDVFHSPEKEMATQFLEQNGGRGKNGTSFRYVWCATKQQQQQHTHTQRKKHWKETEQIMYYLMQIKYKGWW